MKKGKILLVLASTALFAGVLSGCGKDEHMHTFATDWSTNATQHWHDATCGHDIKDSLGDHIDSDGNHKCDVCDYQMSTPAPIDNYYVVKVYEKTGIKASADVERAKKGDIVTVTITEISDGYTLKAVKMNDATLTAETPNVYKFVMPNQSAVVTFDLSVSGDIVADGDFSVELALNASTGIYEAKNVMVINDPKEEASFNVLVGSTKLKALDLDESKSFGDIGIAYSSANTFYVRSHNAYDFFYDPNAEEAPFYIQRVGVDTLPSTVDELSSLLITGYAVRSEAAIYSGVSSMHVEINNVDGVETDDVIKQTYDWKKYSNDVTYGKVIDKDQMDEETIKHVYKALDLDEGVLTVVDTYDKKNGNLVANDDPYRENYNLYGAYSAKYGIIKGDDYDYRRFNLNESHARRTLNVSAHMPAYYIERDIMDSYRVGYEGSDEMNWNERNIVSTRGDNGTFKVAVDTKVEYKLVSSSGADASQAWLFDVDMSFDARGAMTSLTYKKYVYSVDKWDFTKHEALTGKTPTLKKKINATYGYETPTVAFTSDIFDADSYFISKINKIRFYNKNTGKPADDENSYVQLSDNLELYNGDFEKPEDVVFDYEPSTALDIWQYAPTASNNEDVIVKEANDLYYQMSAINEGDAKVTITNHHEGAAGGATFDVDVNVSTNVLLRGFYLTEVDNPYVSITDATPVSIKAGVTCSYNVVKYPEAAPLKYTATSSNNELAKITSEPNSKVLTIDFSASTSITKTTEIKITMTSDKYDPAFSSGAATVFTFYIIPNDIDPTGTWGLVDYESTTYIVFTNEFVAGSSTEKKGRIHDEIDSRNYYDAEFAYTFDGITLTARITKITIISSESWSSDPKDYELVFEYHPEVGDGYYGVGLAENVYDEYSEGFVVSPLLGTVNDEGEFIGLDPFRKIA